jgi:thiamine-monophosphate kinase
VKTLADLGERAAIRRIANILTKAPGSIGIGDDCAAIDIGNDYLLVTTDMIYKKTHIVPQMTPYQMGWFLVAINLSDIAAKGGTPLGLVLSFGFPKKTSASFLTELCMGADACAGTYTTTVVGGDIKEMNEITLCGTAFGIVKKNELMSRFGTKPGDVVAVTGRLGKAGAGYYAIKHHSSQKKLFKVFLEPTPQIKAGKLLAKQHFVTSSMDISDGLSASLYQLQELNNVGFEIQQDFLPLASELKFIMKKKYPIDPYSLALHFGGDYELLVTMPAESIGRAQKILKLNGIDLTTIGIVTKKKNIILLKNNKKNILKNKGYEHFKKHHF